MKRLKRFLGSKKVMAVALMVVVFSAFSSVTAFADPYGGVDPFSTPAGVNIVEELGTGLEGLVEMIFAIIAVVLPVALTVVGAVIAIRKGITLVRRLIGGGAGG
jgi:hypothetical protein